LCLDGSSSARSLYARGLFDAYTKVFPAYNIGVFLV
jgi:hypothetical protein